MLGHQNIYDEGKGKLITKYPWAPLTITEAVAYPHYLIPEHNLHSSSQLQYSVDNSKWYQKPFPYKSTFRLPCLPPNNVSPTELQDGDPITSLITRKLQWETSCNLMKVKYRKLNMNFKALENALLSDKNIIEVDKIQAMFLNMLNKDPDPDFSGLTNWWYSGGRLSSTVVEGQTSLLTSCGEKNQELYVIPLAEDVNHWQPVLTGATKFQTTSKKPIHQITATNNKSGTQNLTGVRQRNLCTISSLVLSSGSFEQGSCYSITSTDGFTSLDLNPFKHGKLCTANINREVSLWDAKRCSPISCHVIEKSCKNLFSNWCSAQYMEPHTLVMADSSTIMLLDTRQAYGKPCFTYCPQDQYSSMLPCEHISLIFRSCKSPEPKRSMYFASSHFVYLFDFSAKQPIQRWTHMMPSTPLYGLSFPVTNMETTEILCIANQDPGDMIAIENDWCEPQDMAKSAALPFGLPTLKDSLHAAQSCGHLLDPRTRSKFQSSLSGVLCLPSRSGRSHTIFTQTSTGDVFSQTLRKKIKKTRFREDDKEKLQIWEDQVLKLNSPQLKFSQELNFQSIFEILENPEHRPRQYSRPHLPKSWKKTRMQLLSYKDFLAPKILDAWGIVESEEECDDKDPCNDVETLNVSDNLSFPTSTKDSSVDNSIPNQMETSGRKRKSHEIGF